MEIKLAEDEDDVLAMALQDSGQATKLPEQGISRLGELAIELIDREAELAQLEEALKRKKADIEDLEQRQIPSLMTELNVSSYTMVDGSKLTMKRDFAISIKAENRERAFQWLEEHDHDSIIKAEVKLGFGKGELEEARRAAAELQRITNQEVEVTRSVHPQTLKAWAKEVRSDQDLSTDERLPEGPDGLFTTFDYFKVELKGPPKKRK